MRRGPGGASAALLCALLGGCLLDRGRPIELNYYLADARDLRVVRRVLVLPFAGDQVPDDHLDSLRRSLLAELGTSHRFHTLDLPPAADDDQELYRTEMRGRISTSALVELGKRYQADGVLFVRVTSWRPYLPPSVGLQLQLVSVHSGEPVWVVDDVFDSSQEEIRQDLLAFRYDKLAPESSLHDWEMIQLSPRRYGRYVCARVVSTLQAIGEIGD